MMKSALRDFKAQVQGGDEVVFYFSGHGVQFGGSNYLIPIDITADSEAQVADDAIPLQRILDDLTEQKARFSSGHHRCLPQQSLQGGRTRHRRPRIGVGDARHRADDHVFRRRRPSGPGQSRTARTSSPNGVFTRVLIQEMRKPGVPAGVLLKDVQSDVVELAHGVNHEQVPALYDQSLGKFFFRPAHRAPPPAAARRPPPPRRFTYRPPRSWMNRTGRASSPAADASDFAAYTKRFPQGHARRRGGDDEPEAFAHGGAAENGGTCNAARALKIVLVPGGPFPAWATSNVLPGVVGRPTLTINKDGSIDCADAFGNRSHAVIDVSDPNNITGKQATHLGFMNRVQMRYPDGSTDTEVTIQGKLVNNEITGTWYDKFQHGEFGWTVRTATAP